jgi:hypothetical protein
MIEWAKKFTEVFSSSGEDKYFVGVGSEEILGRFGGSEGRVLVV